MGRGFFAILGWDKTHVISIFHEPMDKSGGNSKGQNFNCHVPLDLGSLDITTFHNRALGQPQCLVQKTIIAKNLGQ